MNQTSKPIEPITQYKQGGTSGWEIAFLFRYAIRLADYWVEKFYNKEEQHDN